MAVAEAGIVAVTDGGPAPSPSRRAGGGAPSGQLPAVPQVSRHHQTVGVGQRPPYLDSSLFREGLPSVLDRTVYRPYDSAGLTNTTPEKGCQRRDLVFVGMLLIGLCAV